MTPKERQLLDVQGSEKVGVPSLKPRFLEKLHTEVHKHGASPPGFLEKGRHLLGPLPSS